MLKKGWAVITAVILFVIGTVVLLIDGLSVAELSDVIKIIAGALQVIGGVIVAIKAIIDKAKAFKEAKAAE